MKLILARTKAEAYPYMKLGDKYLSILPDDLLGRCDCELLEVGNFWARGDYKEEEILSYCKGNNIKIVEAIAK